jgi:hypothetical protein
MKIKVLFLTLVLALTMVAQNATQSPAPKSDDKAAGCCGGKDAKSCSKAMHKHGKDMGCCGGKDAKMCDMSADGKGCCEGMKDKDGKAMSCCNGKDGKMKCDMSAHKDAANKGCCGDKCPMHGDHAMHSGN